MKEITSLTRAQYPSRKILLTVPVVTRRWQVKSSPSAIHEIQSTAAAGHKARHMPGSSTAQERAGGHSSSTEGATPAVMLVSGTGVYLRLHVNSSATWRGECNIN